MAVTSIVDYLKKNNQDSSYAARKQLAASNGITGYRGTAAQNTKLLQILQSGGASSAQPSGNVTAGNNATTTNSPTTTATKSYQSTFKPTELTDHYKNKMLAAENPFKASSYTNKYKNKLSQIERNKPDAYESAYEGTINEILDTIKNRGQFDIKSDANYNTLYNQYKEQYETQANKAMNDTLASANAATGGYGSTYGQAVAQQAYDTTMQGLNSQNVNLMNLAYQMYSDDRANDYNKLAAYQGQDNTMYNRYRDTVSDWQNDRDYYANQYQQNYSNDRNAYENDRNYFSNSYWNSFQNDRSAYENDRTFDYGMDQDAMDREDSNYQNALQTAMGLAQSGLPVPSYLTEAIDKYNTAHGLSGGSAGQLASIAARALAAKKSSGGGSSGGSSRRSSGGSSKSSGKRKITDGDGISSGTGAAASSGLSAQAAEKLKNMASGFQKAGNSILGFRTLQSDLSTPKRNSYTELNPPAGTSNRSGNGWVYVEGMGRMTWDELESEIDSGNVVETMKNGVYSYRKA